MKMMTLNLNTYQEENQLEKFRCIAKKIVEEQIDVICFCEAGQTFNSPWVNEYCREDNAVKLICDQANRLVGSDAYHFVWALSHYGYKIYEEGLAIMARCPIKNVASQYVSQTDDIFTFKSRKIVKATLTYNEHDIDVFSCLLGWADDEHEPFSEQFRRLDEWVKKESTADFVVLAGDFSNDASTAAYQQVIAAGYKDQYLVAKPDGNEDATFIYPEGFDTTNLEKAVRVDFIFANQQTYPVKMVDRYFDYPNIVSDHLAVMVEWEI